MPSNKSSTNNLKDLPLKVRLQKLAKADLARRDVFGRTILHILVLTGRYDLLRDLLRNLEAKSIITLVDYENGWNILHYVFFHKRVTCFKVILEYLKSVSPNSSIVVANNTLIYELLKSKDRNRLTPLQLLQNDFKDLLWIPEYINEKNEYHFSYRFQGNGNELLEDEATPEEAENTEKEFIKLKRKFIRNIPNDWWNASRGGSEIYMLGSNKNNNLGVGDSTDRSIPSKISHEYFKSLKNVMEGSIHDTLVTPRYRKVKISKYHAVVLTQGGELFSCGIGSRGRLGHGFSDIRNYFRFSRIDYFIGEDYDDFKFIKDFVISDNHSMAITISGSLYVWGFNNCYQLGFHSSSASSAKTSSTKDTYESFEATPQEITSGDLRSKGLAIKGMAISNIHSMVYTKNSLYYWGLVVGQVGSTLNSADAFDYKINGTNYKGYHQKQPKEFPFNDDIKLVETCETCTVLVTEKDIIHVYFQYQHGKLPRLPSRGNEGFERFKPSKLTKAPKVKKVSMKSHEFVAILFESGDVLSFSLDSTNLGEFYKSCKTTRYNSVWKAYDTEMCATDIDVSYDGSVIICTRNGSVFIKYAQPGGKLRRKSMNESTLAIPATSNKFKKIDNLNHIVRVSCDNSFSSFNFIKDDIDLIPLKLQKNDFNTDMEYLSELKDTDLYRKQDQLLDVDHDINSYICDFLYPLKNQNSSINELQNFSFVSPEDEEDGELESGISKDSKRITDSLHTRYSVRHTSNKTRRIKTKDTFEHFDENHIRELKELLKSDESFIIARFDSSLISSDKSYDIYIRFESYPSVAIGIHKELFCKRSSFCKTIFNPVNPGEYFIDEGIEGLFNPDNSELLFKSNINLKSMLILIHFIYTNRVLDIWDDYPSRYSCPNEIKQVKKDFDILVSIFRLSDSFGKFSNDNVFRYKVGSLLDDEPNGGDVLVTLKDGQIYCHSNILIARSAFFETILSNRWDTTEAEIEDEGDKCLNFNNLTIFKFEFILRHLYGFDNIHLFDYFLSVIEKLSDTDEFINHLLEIIEITDELLLFQLKNLCQLVLKDLINNDNVMILLEHADYLSAPKLFMNCCWFIYNNLDQVLFDSTFNSLEFDTLAKLEKQLKLFQDCKKSDFITGDKGEINEKYTNDWFSNKSNLIIEDFISDLSSFNENFMSDAKGFYSFEPLVDLKYDLKVISNDYSKRRAGRKSSSAGSRSNSNVTTNDLADFRRATNQVYGYQSSTSVVPQDSNDIAVEDNADDFEVVGKKNKTKPKSISPSSSGMPSRTGSNTDLNESIKSPPMLRKSSLTAINNAIDATRTSGPRSTPAINRKPSNSSSNGLSPHSNWASKSNGQSILGEKTPILGSHRKPSVENTGSFIQPKPSKIKIGPAIKLSQRERKKLAMQESTNEEPSSRTEPEGSGNAWGVAASSTGNSSIINDLPPLGASNSKPDSANNGKTYQKSKPKNDIVPQLTASSIDSNAFTSPINKVYATPSLTEIMLHESLKIEEEQRKENERQSLQEVQQEQEFARWWEEEAAKVQKQMNAFTLNDTEKPKKQHDNRKLSDSRSKKRNSSTDGVKPKVNNKQNSKQNGNRSKSGHKTNEQSTNRRNLKNSSNSTN